MASAYSGHCPSGAPNPCARENVTSLSRNALTPLHTPQASASASGRAAREPILAQARQPARTAPSNAASGITVGSDTVSVPPVG